MSGSTRILVVGEVIVDVALPSEQREAGLRLGGIIHPCRTLWALDIPYELALVSPSYLSQQALSYATSHGASQVHLLGEVRGAPNLILIPHLQEAHDHRYDLILREDHSVNLDATTLDSLGNRQYADVLYLPFGACSREILTALGQIKAAVHIDCGNCPVSRAELAMLGRPAETFILSTSSKQFSVEVASDIGSFIDNLVPAAALSFLLKENRGGSRLFKGGGKVVSTPAHLRRVVHSVGVGDSFDAAYVALRRRHGDNAALSYAALIAGDYASTKDDVAFKGYVSQVLNIQPHVAASMQGVVLPWERRRKINVYIAAADFANRDCTHIDRLCSALQYHNFTPRRPVQEHGEVLDNATALERSSVFAKDMELLERCDALVAVYDTEDAGTLIEVGLAAGCGKPVLVFDPLRRARNLILTEIAAKVAHDLDGIICEMFRIFRESNA